MNDYPIAKPSHCPSCGDATDKILVCENCWSLVPQFDQVGFRRQYVANPDKPQAWRFKAEKILRELKGWELTQ